MKPLIIKHARAMRDLEDRSDFIREHNPRAALRFLDEAEATFRRLATMPGSGTRFEPDNAVFGDIRFLPISRFKQDLVFYRPIENGIEVLRVLHGARDLHAILVEEFGLAVEDDAGDSDQGEGS